jgi:hypothetical protein
LAGAGQRACVLPHRFPHEVQGLRHASVNGTGRDRDLGEIEVGEPVQQVARDRAAEGDDQVTANLGHITEGRLRGAHQGLSSPEASGNTPRVIQVSRIGRSRQSAGSSEEIGVDHGLLSAEEPQAGALAHEKGASIAPRRLPLPFNPPILISHWGKSSPAATRCLKEKGGETGETRRPTLRRAIVEALTRMAPGLNLEERIDLMTRIPRATAAHWRVRSAPEGWTRSACRQTRVTGLNAASAYAKPIVNRS